MIAFFTSTLGGSYKVDGKRYPTYLPDKNGFAEHLRKYWKENARVLFVPASPEAMERNDSTRDCLKAAFPMSGFRISAFDMYDCRKEELPKEPDAYDVVILGGGHVPTQNQFLKKSV